jgi:multiple sugar transport system substrate-binding protein
MKKFLSIMLSCLLCTSIVACGDSTNRVSSNAPKTTITIAARSGSHCDVINAVKDDFETSHNCTLNIIPLSANDIHDNVIADIKNEAGQYDIIMIDDPLMPEYIEKDLLCNLTKLGYSDDDDFVEKSRLLGKDPYPLGATYALPFSGNVQLIFYNENNIDAAALTNWNDIYAACQKAKNDGKEGYAIRGQSGNPIVSDFLPILWAFGGDIFDSNNNVILDSKEAKAALSFYCDLYSTGGNYEKDDLIDAISSGKASVALGWPSWFITGDGTKANIAQIPGQKDSSAQVLATGEIGNWLLGITSNSANKDLALELIKYLTSSDVQKKALSYGGIPTRVSIFRSSEVTSKYPYFEAIYSGTNNSRVRPRTTKWSRIEDVFGEELSKCIDGKQSVDDTIKNSHNAIKKLANEQ